MLAPRSVQPRSALWMRQECLIRRDIGLSCAKVRGGLPVIEVPEDARIHRAESDAQYRTACPRSARDCENAGENEDSGERPACNRYEPPRQERGTLRAQCAAERREVLRWLSRHVSLISL